MRLHPSARGCSSSSSSLDQLRLAQVGAHVMPLKVFSAPRAKKWPSLRRQPRPCGIQQPGLVGLHANLRHPLKSVASPSDLDASSRVHCRVTRSVQSANEVERFLRRAPKKQQQQQQQPQPQEEEESGDGSASGGGSRQPDKRGVKATAAGNRVPVRVGGRSVALVPKFPDSRSSGRATSGDWFVFVCRDLLKATDWLTAHTSVRMRIGCC